MKDGDFTTAISNYVLLGLAAFSGALVDAFSTNTIFRLIGNDIGENSIVIKSLYNLVGSNAPYIWFPAEGGVIFLGAVILYKFGQKFPSAKVLSTCFAALIASSGFLAFANNFYVIVQIVKN